MTQSKKIAILAAVVLPLVALLAVLFRAQKTPGAAREVAAPAPANKADVAHELASLEAELKKKPDHLPILLRMAELKQQAGSASEALAFLRRAAAADPKNVEANFELGRALYDANDPKGAIEANERVIESNPRHVDALYNLGAIYGNVGDDTKARLYFHRAVDAGPGTDGGRKAKAALEQLDKAPTTPALPAGHPSISPK